MIAITFTPALSIVPFVREFIEALAAGDYGAALAGLDMRERRWTKAEVAAQVAAATEGSGVSSARGLTRSASPVVEPLPGDAFRIAHRLPVRGRWTEARAVFSFHRVRGQYFRVVLEGIVPASARAP